MNTDAQELIDAIGVMVDNAFDEWTFRDVTASINRDTHEVVFDMDLRNDSRDAQLKVIRTMMSSVYPVFEQDDVSFTFVFSEHDEARSNMLAAAELAVV